MAAAQLVDRLGYFAAFMKAVGQAGPGTRAELFDDAAMYDAHLIDGAELVADASRLLGIPEPAAP